MTTPAGLPPLVEPGPPLSPTQKERWSRHLLLPQLGEVAQRRLRNARVLVVGAGGLGAPVLQYLAAAGVGRLGIVDDDVVEASNLQRQVIHGVADVGRRKVDSAADAVARIDPDVDVVRHHVRLEESTVDLVADYDLVLDGTDNFPTRYLVNDACVRHGVPEVWGSIFRFDAQVAVFWGRPPAGVEPVQLRHLFPEPPAPGTVPSCAEGGVLGALAGQVGSVMATEAVKLITGAGRPLLGRVLVLDALAARWSEIPLRGGPLPEPAPSPALAHATVPAAAAAPATAPTTPAAPATAALFESEQGVGRTGTVHSVLTTRSDANNGARGAGSGRGTGPGPGPGTVVEVEARALAERLAADDVVLVDVREAGERDIVTIPGAVHVPMASILDGTGFAQVPRDRSVVLYCRSGVRSEQALHALLDAGYDDVAHLTGGVLAWVDEIDPTLARY